MFSQKNRSQKSPVESIQTVSERTEPNHGKADSRSRLTSSSEEETKIKTIPTSAVQASVFKTTKSPASSRSSSAASTKKHFSTVTNMVKKATPIVPQPSAVQKTSSQEKDKSIKELIKSIPVHSLGKQLKALSHGTVSVRDIERDALEIVSAANGSHSKKNLSVFEKVDIHDGHVTYLGTGTSSLLDNCLSGYSSGERHHKNYTVHRRKYEYPSKSVIRASILDDYSYDGIISPNHHLTRSHSYSHNNYNHHHSHSHNRSSYRKRSPAELSLCEIRQVNDALAKYGIPVFSNQANPYNYQPQQRNVGDIISACRLLVDDPTLAAHANGHTAVQHAWNAANHYTAAPAVQHVWNAANQYATAPAAPGYAPTPAAPGYASPAVRGVTSHLFNSGSQPPYQPVRSVISQLFSGGQQAPTQHFTGSPFSNSLQQYPANNNHMY